MKISIVVPVYNGEETLERCLKAINNLAYPKEDFEVVVVNDGSKDRTEEIIKSLNIKNLIYIKLEENQGRVIARETGAKAANYENLLFVDSRVIVDSEILQNLCKLGYSPAMAGDLNHNKYKSDYDTIFYLIRKKIYSPYFPQTEYAQELYIDENNFKKAPKGTTCFFISKELFFKTTPERKAKSTSDDTILMRNIVFRESKRILRHTSLKIEYLQRVNDNIFDWIHHRGKLWADFYLQDWNKYSFTYLILHILLVNFLFKGLGPLILFLLVILVGVSFFLSEDKKDFKILFSSLPKLSFYFYLGTLKKLYQKVFER